MRLFHRSKLCLAGLIAALLLSLPVASATAATPPGAASYNGETIYLSQGWQGAHACAVFSSTDVQCFTTATQLAAAVALYETLNPSPDTGCGSNSLYLYQNIDFGGNELVLTPPGNGWIDLQDYGFGNETSSWINGMSCNAYAAMSTNGSGSHLTMQANGSSLYVGSTWNDAINSVDLG